VLPLFSFPILRDAVVEVDGGSYIGILWRQPPLPRYLARQPSVKRFTPFKCFRRNGHHSLCMSAFCRQKWTVLSGRSRAGRATLGRTGTTLAGQSAATRRGPAGRPRPCTARIAVVRTNETVKNGRRGEGIFETPQSESRNAAWDTGRRFTRARPCPAKRR
jgi:hypothetical protein